MWKQASFIWLQSRVPISEKFKANRYKRSRVFRNLWASISPTAGVPELSLESGVMDVTQQWVTYIYYLESHHNNQSLNMKSNQSYEAHEQYRTSELSINAFSLKRVSAYKGRTTGLWQKGWKQRTRSRKRVGNPVLYSVPNGVFVNVMFCPFYPFSRIFFQVLLTIPCATANYE